MTPYSIDLNRLEVYEAGALIVSLLAYPGESEEDDQRRCGAFTSLCACALRRRPETEPDWATQSQLVKPVYTLQTERDCNRGLRTLRLRLHERMVAARMAYPFLIEAQTGEPPRLPAGRSKHLRVNPDELLRLRLR
jgi:hypothetical protein